MHTNMHTNMVMAEVIPIAGVTASFIGVGTFFCDSLYVYIEYGRCRL